MLELMNQPVTQLSGWGLVLVGFFYAVFHISRLYLAKRGVIIPATAIDWIKQLGGDNLVAAYLTAKEQAENPDQVLTMATAIVQAYAERYAKIQVPDSIALMLVSMIDVLVNHEGYAAIEDFIKRFPNPSDPELE